MSYSSQSERNLSHQKTKSCWPTLTHRLQKVSTCIVRRDAHVHKNYTAHVYSSLTSVPHQSICGDCLHVLFVEKGAAVEEILPSRLDLRVGKIIKVEKVTLVQYCLHSHAYDEL